MRTSILKRAAQAFTQTYSVRQPWGVMVMTALLLASANLAASPTVTTLGGGKPGIYYGYSNGNTLHQALFHTPCGLALDISGDNLFVADRDNNVIRWLDLVAGQTWTLLNDPSINKPIAVAIDPNLFFYVLNRGSGANGSVITFDLDINSATYGEAVLTNAMQLTNAAGMSLDSDGNIYVTASNQLIRIDANTANRTTIATITNAGTSLQGIAIKLNGSIAACDSGNNGIWIINPSATNSYIKLAGFHGKGDFNTNGNNIASSSTAKFNQPMNVAETGDGTLIVTDNGNNRVKAVLPNGVVTNLCGVTAQYWGGSYPGWYDSTAFVPDSIAPNAQSRLPVGVVFAPDGSVYTTEDFYHTIRKLTGTGLQLMPTPPPPPPVPDAPIIGWFDYEGDNNNGFFTFFHPVTNSIVLNNDANLAIDPGTVGISTYYISGPFPLPSNPSATNGSTPPPFRDGLSFAQPLPVTFESNLVVKAVSVNSIGQSGPVATAQFIFQAANPTITGNNAAQFIISDLTSNVMIYYTIDGSDPSNFASVNCFGPIAITNGNSVTLSIYITTNTLFKARAFRSGYYPSGIGTQPFTVDKFVPNSISFGFASGEASSDFVASPGQIFYAPVTLNTLPGTVMDQLQFSLMVNKLGASPSITPGAYAFQSMLMKPDPDIEGVIVPIPPFMFADNSVPTALTNQIVRYEGTNFVSLVTTNLSLNQIAVGWLERQGQTNLFDTKAQNLLSMSLAHDDLFPRPSQPNGVIVGGYSFQVPTNAAPGDTYQIRIKNPSATTDGIGEPGSAVFIFAPTNGSFSGGAVNSIKNVVVGQRKYIAGDAAPFRWFNAGDFGDGTLDAPDVAQVFEAAVYGFNMPPAGTDLFDSMDSCGYTYVDSGYGYLTNSATLANTSLLFDGNDTTINQIAFGDGTLDVADVYVTFRRSQFTNMVWFNRYWTNDVAHGVSGRVAEIVPNMLPMAVFKPLVVSKISQQGGYISVSVTNQPKVVFTAGDIQTNAGSTIQIPITASILGSYPLRLLMLNLTVVPLDNSPALTSPVSFSYNPALGSPWTTDQKGNGNYSAVWLNNSITGLSNNVTLGTLTVTLPTNATSSSAYAVHFDHASASPNGLASFPKQAMTGLVTFSSRTNSSYGDGIPDAWRLRYFLTLDNYLSQTNADADGDGQNNLQEYLAGTDPTDPKSFFKNIGTDQTNAWQPNDCVISWPSTISKQYVIERSPSLSTPSWTSVATNNGTGNPMEYHDTSGGNVRYYRVRVQ